MVAHGPGVPALPGQIGAKLQVPPAHVTSQAHAPVQSTLSHDCAPIQSTLDGPPTPKTAWQLPGPLQSMSQLPLHVTVWQWSWVPSQTISQGPAAQSNDASWQVSGPSHVTMQFFAEQTTGTGLAMVPRQAPSPLHATLQPVAAAQSTPARQESLPVQSTEHGMPAGQTT